MAICVAALVVLTTTMTGAPRTPPGVKIALAALGVGLGVFIAPDNSASISDVPADNSGEAGGLRHHGRVLPHCSAPVPAGQRTLSSPWIRAAITRRVGELAFSGPPAARLNGPDSTCCTRRG